MQMKKTSTVTVETTITLTREELDEAVREYLLQRTAKKDTNSILDANIRYDTDRHGEEITGVTLTSRDCKELEE